MIMVSLGMLEGSYVTEGLCNATNEWQCELYQSDVEHYIPTFSVGGGSWQSEQASGFGSGPYDFGEVGHTSHEFSCSRYQIIEPAGIEQCKKMAANLVLFWSGGLSESMCNFMMRSRIHVTQCTRARVAHGDTVLLSCRLQTVANFG